MKKNPSIYLFPILIINLILLSCDKKIENDNRKNDLVLKILNDSVKSVLIDNDSYYLRELNSNSNYNSQSLNIVNYSLKNNSKKKYFLVFNDEYFKSHEHHILSDNKTISKTDYMDFDINFNIYNKDSLVFGDFLWPISLRIESATNDFKKCKFKVDDYLTEKQKQNKEKYDHDFYKHSFIIYPNEIKYFTTFINLPIRSPSEEFFWYSKLNSKNKYFASIILANKKKTIINFLTKNQRKEINENDYTIFDGVIESNKVPVTIISMTKKQERDRT